MITNLIYISVAAKLIFVLYLAVQAITRGVEAKNLNKKNSRNQFRSKNIASELKKLKTLVKKLDIDLNTF